MAHIRPKLSSVVFFFVCFQITVCPTAWSDWPNALRSITRETICQLKFLNNFVLHKIQSRCAMTFGRMWAFKCLIFVFLVSLVGNLLVFTISFWSVKDYFKCHNEKNNTFLTAQRFCKIVLLRKPLSVVRCLLIQRYFCAVCGYAGKADLNKCY